MDALMGACPRHDMRIAMQDGGGKSEDFSCGKYAGDAVQVEAVLVSEWGTACTGASSVLRARAGTDGRWNPELDAMCRAGAVDW